MKKYIFPVFLLAIVQYIITTEMSMVMPLAPTIASTYNIDPARVATLGVGYAISGIAAPRINKLADRFGEKYMLLIAFFVFGLGAFIISIIESYIGFFIGRMILGLGFFALLGLIINYTSNIIPYERMGVASGIYKLAFGLAVMTSPSIGIFMVNKFSLRELYQILSIVVVILILLGLLLPNTTKKETSNSMNTSKPKIKLILLAAFLFNVPAIYFYNYFSVYLIASGNPTSVVTMMYTIVGTGTLFSAIFILLFSDRIGKWNLMMLGSLIASFVILGISGFNGFLVYVFVFFFGFTYDTLWGLFMPVSGEIDFKNSNYILGILSMGMATANVFGGLTAPYVYRLGFNINVFVSASSILLGTIVYYYATRNIKERLNSN